MLSCLAGAAKARAVNQLVKETGIARTELCRLFESYAGSKTPELSQDAVSRLVKALAPAYA